MRLQNLSFTFRSPDAFCAAVMSLVFIACLTAGCFQDAKQAGESHPEINSVTTAQPSLPTTLPVQHEPDVEPTLTPVSPDVHTKVDATTPERPNSDISTKWTEGKTVELKFTNWAHLQDQILTLQGKTVLVYLWSTNCLICRQEFPRFLELQAEFPDNLVAISVCCDFQGSPEHPVETYYEAAKIFLDTQQAGIQNYLLENPQKSFFEMIELKDLPAIYVYNSKGLLQKRFDLPASNEKQSDRFGVTIEQDLRPLVRRLVINEN